MKVDVRLFAEEVGKVGKGLIRIDGTVNGHEYFFLHKSPLVKKKKVNST